MAMRGQRDERPKTDPQGGGDPRWPSRWGLLGHLLLDVLEEVVVGGSRVAALLHQVLPQRSLGRPVVPAPAQQSERGRKVESLKVTGCEQNPQSNPKTLSPSGTHTV